ncbi:hypothetical protein MGYG_08897 [Nannizzia gypsea CBS 118893]|uniref:Uncharacterized protein n=1 Tax=Arthroderma gypseum (strain ATCC MYA-4604 / CBS 118893) TaxID=535722 RepID=E5R0S2_ARTGP|nr:hypothetical protein MGYG_08897 [Nannizzia gypsea CBS 118893]EFQ97578.1 hypothetical protein MGYG_08897 [Nannizzia gypsea CBS 118893]
MFIPFPIVCFQCGTDQNPCRCKVVGPTLGFAVGIVSAVICYPAAIFCGCWATDAGKRMLARPVEWNQEVSQIIPF